MLVFQKPVEFVIVAGTKITHHMLIAEEEHDGQRIVELIHLVEIADLVKVAEVDDGKVFDAFSNACSCVSRSDEGPRV